MNCRAACWIRGLGSWFVVLVAVGSPLASHVVLAWGHSYACALVLAAAQSLAGGTVLWTSLPRHRWLAPLGTTILLAVLIFGARQGPEIGLMAVAGATHAMLYTGLLVLFAATLRPGRTALATTFASRLNPSFHAGMIPYTRAVTAAWCAFFALQLAMSAILLAIEPGLWRVFVTTLHAPLVAGMLGLEFLVRRWRWRHEHYTSLADTIRGVRRLAQGPARSETSR